MLELVISADKTHPEDIKNFIACVECIEKQSDSYVVVGDVCKNGISCSARR
ncbi:MAG: hypothetical protein LAP85_09095 [Acidobacteriia bacterium]|nr:hypothetical protein [Terriglobia bacterium]